MPAKDIFHQVVRRVLEQEGWEITHDPYRLEYEDVKMAVDLGAEQLLAAEKDTQRIAIEIKSFVADSFIYAFHAALGQFLNYRWALTRVEPERILFLAVPKDVYEEHFRYVLVQEMMAQYNLHLLVFDPDQETITQWIK